MESLAVAQTGLCDRLYLAFDHILCQEVWWLQQIPLYLFGWIWGGLTLLTALSGRYATVLEKHCGPRALLLCIGVLPIVGYLGLAVAGPLAGIAIAALFFVARGLGQLLADALNHRIPSQFDGKFVGASGFRACFAVTGPLVGYGLDRLGMDVILGLLAVLSALIVLVCLLPLLFNVPSRKVLLLQQFGECGHCAQGDDHNRSKRRVTPRLYVMP